MVAEYRGHFEPLVDREAAGGPGETEQGLGRDAAQRQAAYLRWCESWKQALEGLDPVPRVKLPQELDRELHRQRHGNAQDRPTARSRHLRLVQLAKAQHLWEVALGPMLRAMVERLLWKELGARSLEDGGSRRPWRSGASPAITWRPGGATCTCPKAHSASCGPEKTDCAGFRAASAWPPTATTSSSPPRAAPMTRGTASPPASSTTSTASHGGWARVIGRTDTAVQVEAALEGGRPLWVYEVRPDGVAAIVV